MHDAWKIVIIKVLDGISFVCECVCVIYMRYKFQSYFNNNIVCNKYVFLEGHWKSPRTSTGGPLFFSHTRITLIAFNFIKLPFLSVTLLICMHGTTIHTYTEFCTYPWQNDTLVLFITFSDVYLHMWVCVCKSCIEIVIIIAVISLVVQCSVYKKDPAECVDESDIQSITMHLSWMQKYQRDTGKTTTTQMKRCHADHKDMCVCVCVFCVVRVVDDEASYVKKF